MEIPPGSNWGHTGKPVTKEQFDRAFAVKALEQRWALPCIVCGSELEAVSDKDPVQPHGAVTFRAYGQYGSTVFDPQDQSQLYINVCDNCLTEKGKAGTVWHACYEQRAPIVKFERPWQPDADPSVDDTGCACGCNNGPVV